MPAVTTKHLTIEEARRLFSYDPETGVITRKVAVSCIPVGHIVKKKTRVNGEFINSNRLAWFLYYGEWPKGLVDHKNRNKNDESINNLRDASYTQNQYNKVSVNPHGYKGVTWRNRLNKPWLAKIRVDGVRINLGSFKTKEEAAAVYQEACLKYHGEYAQLGIG